MKSIHIVLLVELAALALLVHQGRSEGRPARPLTGNTLLLLNPNIARRTTSRGPTPVGTVGGVQVREGGGLYY